MFYFADPKIIGIAFIIAIAILLFQAIGSASFDNQVKKEANEAAPVKATVKSIMPAQNGQTQVIFEKEDGTRVNVIVPNCTLLEGEVGMLRHASSVFGSFTRIDS